MPTKNQTAGAQVAFIAHPTDMSIFKSYISALRPDKQYSDALLLKLFEWTQPYPVKSFSRLGFNRGITADARFYMVPFLPEMTTISVKNTIGKVERTLAMAAAEGCTVAALGGFTSIVVQNSEHDLAAKHGIRITSGNTFTAALIIRAVEIVAARFGVPLSQMTMAVIGASGDIGSACVGYFSRYVKKMLLTARGSAALEAVIKRYVQGAVSEMSIEKDARAAVAKADCCIFVTSAHCAMFTQEDFKPGTIVCDASVPANVTAFPELRKDVFVFHGGIASIPFEIDTSFDIGLASTYSFYGCQLEGLLLALHPELPCSWGRGNISQERIDMFLSFLEIYPDMKPVYTIEKIVYNEQMLDSYASWWRENRFTST